MPVFDDALEFFDSRTVTARMYRGDLDLGAQVVYEPHGVMMIDIGTYQALFTQEKVAIREDDAWSDASDGNPTLELYRLLDPRTFRRLSRRARETPGSAGAFHLSFFLDEVFPKLSVIRETGIPFAYAREVKSGTIAELIPETAREWASSLVERPRDVTFHVTSDGQAYRLTEMIQHDLDLDRGLFSLRFSYG